MRWFHVAVVVVFALAIIVFAVQNLEPVTISFLGFSARAPVALVAVVIYLLGMATGSSLIALIRKSLAAARGYSEHSPPR